MYAETNIAIIILQIIKFKIKYFPNNLENQKSITIFAESIRKHIFSQSFHQIT